MFRIWYLTRTKKSEESFFEILQRKTKVSLRSGVAESNVVTDHKSFESVELASKFVDKTVKDKLKAGYKDLNNVLLDTSIPIAKPSKNKRKFVEDKLISAPSLSDSSSEAVLEQVQTIIRSNFTLVLSSCEALRNELKQMEIKRTQWLNWADVFSSDDQDLSSTVSLNIGGNVITLRRDLIDLHASNGNFFGLISGRFDKLLPKDRNGRVYLDLDSKWIEPLINLARDMTMWDGVDENTRPTLCCDSLFASGMNVVQPPTALPPIFDSNILSEVNVDLRENLTEWLGWSGVLDSKLLFRGSLDGFTGKAFHSKCDGHKDTIFIIRDTDGNVFGGYADVAWNRDSMYTSSSKCFLFSLKKDGVERKPPVKFSIRKGYESYAICNNLNYLCTFGGGHDMYIANDCNLNSASSSNAGHSYDCPPGSLSSQRYFKVSEIEVFEVVQSDDSTKAIRSPNVRTHSLTHPHEEATVAVLNMTDTLMNAYGEYFKDTLIAIDNEMSQLRELEASLKQCQSELLPDAIVARDEMKYIATFIDLNLEGKTVANGVESLEHVQTEIETLLQAMANQAVSKVMSEDASVVGINVAHGNMFVVSKASLAQAPSGSILANMASDVWGHDLDSEGNIIQDVNPELFRLIIAHLRLKTLLQRVGRMSEMPPISVYEEQKAAMTNLLAFYAMSEVILNVLKRGR